MSDNNKDHPINQLPERSAAKSADWDSGVPELPSKPERALVIPANKHVQDMSVTYIEDPPDVAADKSIVDHDKPARF